VVCLDEKKAVPSNWRTRSIIQLRDCNADFLSIWTFFAFGCGVSQDTVSLKLLPSRMTEKISLQIASTHRELSLHVYTDSRLRGHA